MTVSDAQRLLMACPYDRPAYIGRSKLPLARLLVKHGLLEENPWTPGMYRCTAKGELVRARLATGFTEEDRKTLTARILSTAGLR